MPLTIAPISKEITIVKMFLNSKLKNHLRSLGITLNSRLVILSQANGSVVVSIKGSRIALDHDVAKNIFII
jgi:ferrous iron transport protein A